MISIYREMFNRIKDLIRPLIDNLGIKTIHFGGLERMPKNQIDADKLLNLILIKPLTIDESFVSAQRTARQNITVWKIYYITNWSGAIDDFGNLMLGAEQILDVFDENLLPTFNVIKPNAQYRIIPKLQEVQRLLTENDAEIYFISGVELNLACIVLEIKIESLIQKSIGG